MSQIELDKERESHEVELQRQREGYRTDLDRLRNENRSFEKKWASLELRTTKLRLEINHLRAAGSVAQETSDASSQTGDNQGLWDNLPPEEVEVWRAAFSLCLTKDPEQIFAFLSQGHRRQSQKWHDEKAKLVESHSTMEERIAVLIRKVEASEQHSNQLQKRLEAYEANERRLNYDIEHLQLRNTAYAKVLKDLNDCNKILEACVQHQSKQYLEAHDNIDSALALPLVSAAAVASASEDSDGSRPRVGKKTVASSGESSAPDSIEALEQDTLGLRSSARHIEINTHSESPGLNLAMIPTTSRGHKRTLSELLGDESDTSSGNDQRRRTGSGSYVAISSQAWKEAGKSETAEVRPPERNLAANWRAQENDFSAMKQPFDLAEALIRPVVSLPPSPENVFSQKLDVDSRAPEMKEMFSNNSLVGSGPVVPIHPQAGFRKWKNSMLKKRL